MVAPRLSVIVPFYNKPENLARCLAGLRASTLAEFELLLVDDCSTDPEAVRIAEESGARCVRMERNGGPGIARNAGARHATGEVLVFVDSDVVVHAEALAALQRVFAERPDVAAAFGSYDDRPAAVGLVSEYRNLLHHHTHQSGPEQATTFWAGCGAMRRAVFERHGGFDPVYRQPSIEDIELGMRLHAAGESILLLPEIRCTHLKRWNFKEMLRTDIGARAIPWTHLLIERPTSGGDLNVSASQKLCVACAYLGILVPLAGPLIAPASLGRGWLFIGLAFFAPIAWINRDLYRVFFAHCPGARGLLFGVASVALHVLYYLYSGFAFVWAHLSFRVGGVRTGTRGA